MRFARALELEQAEAQNRRTAEDERVRTETEGQAAALVVGSIGKGLEQLANGNICFNLDERLPSAYEKLRTDFNATLTQLRTLIHGILASADTLKDSTGDIATAVTDLSQRTEAQAAGLAETAAALDQITEIVHRSTQSLKQGREAAALARAEAEQSVTIVGKAIIAMGEIEQSSRQISRIIGVIDEIAFQTNLLALNAGVEAARAGDMGRGFAVVASEVRSLSHRSAEAAKEIAALISASAQQVASGVKFVGQTGEALSRIVDQVAAVDGVVERITVSAENQASGLQEVNAAVREVDLSTQQNAAMAEQSRAAFRVLLEETKRLTDLVGHFERERDAKEAEPGRTNLAELFGLPPSPTPARPRRPAAATGAADGWEPS